MPARRMPREREIEYSLEPGHLVRLNEWGWKSLLTSMLGYMYDKKKYGDGYHTPRADWYPDRVVLEEDEPAEILPIDPFFDDEVNDRVW